MIFEEPISEPEPARRALGRAHRLGEPEAVAALLDRVPYGAEARARIEARAAALVAGVRAGRRAFGGLDVFLAEYGLSTEEGVSLMCLAESLLRVPDRATAERLIRDKIGGADWASHLGRSDSLFVNASTWALMLSGRVIQLDPDRVRDVEGLLRHLVTRSGEPVIREAMRHAMRIIGGQFIMGETIGEALARAKADRAKGYTHSFDMLGEGARTAARAETHFQAYLEAIRAIGVEHERPGDAEISVKLSALHPRYEYAQRSRVLDQLVPCLAALARAARESGAGLTVDAEEADRLELSLDVMAAVLGDSELQGWDGFGLAVQAYQKRALAIIDWLAELAAKGGRRLAIRLVKGAYWDTEIKRAQEGGVAGYPVFTRKAASDASFLVCAQRLLAHPERFRPQFATHNAHTLAAVEEMAGDAEIEFQLLHGMSEALYEQVVGTGPGHHSCRIYAPVGGQRDLLAYLVRRLLENGANSSFVNRIADDAAPVADIVADPFAKLAAFENKPNPRIPPPAGLYGAARRNSAGLELWEPACLRDLAGALAQAHDFSAAPLVGGERQTGGRAEAVRNPADRRQTVGRVAGGTPADREHAWEIALDAAPAWEDTGVAARAEILERAADLVEARRAELMALCILEAGKTVPDALAEVREAVDFCRYYAHRARLDFADGEPLGGPTGSDNRLTRHGRGVFICISPWNFPLAIFTGQVAAALLAGNAVIAKPAEQTPLIAMRMAEILLDAGIPGEVLQLIPGDGPGVGASLVADHRGSGVAFTGSFAAAQDINRRLAARPGPIAPLIAETGGMNAMIVDSTALWEQVSDDVLASAFTSAGQRCSALRVLFVQEEIADGLIEMLAGAAANLVIGDPRHLSTDLGPLIDGDAVAAMEAHAERMAREGKTLFEGALPPGTEGGTFFAPRIFQVADMAIIGGEAFGPILHVIAYAAHKLDRVIDDINGAGFGLTLGIHSRIDATAAHLHRRLRVGNTYVNRNMIGAMVGVQPFGGEGYSGTGPKAGGPDYLHRFATERTLTVDRTAGGGNAALLSLAGEDRD